MIDLVIVGAGGFGREVFQWASDWIKGRGPAGADGYRIKGFLSNSSTDLDGFSMPVPVLGTDDGYPIAEQDRFIIALGVIDVKKRAVARLRSRGARFHTLVHPSAIVAERATLGEGVVICPFAAVLPFATVDDFTMFNIYSSAGHDSKIGKYCVLSPYATLNGFVVLDDDVFLGSHTTVVAGTRVSQGSKASANSAVMRDVPPNTLVVGNPGKHFSLPGAKEKS
jgi:sugar O-acyltransferase (sialic acid O-acetyltransferase NeuD family)